MKKCMNSTFQISGHFPTMISMPEGGAVRDPLGVVVTIFGKKVKLLLNPFKNMVKLVNHTIKNGGWTSRGIGYFALEILGFGMLFYWIKNVFEHFYI